MPYKFNCQDRNYNDWDVVDAASLKEEKVDLVEPSKHKLFNQDIFTIDDGNIKIVHSSARNMKCIPGVLVLEGNKRYGKIKKNRYFYKCVPDDKRFPEFLTAYSPKIKFIKKMENKYIVFKFKSWDEKHPICEIVQTIGDVGKLENFYEYQLYCKSLYASIQDFRQKTIKALKVKSEEAFIEEMKEKYNAEDRVDWDIITIDPTLSKDFDDGMSLIEKDDSYVFSIYISNVSFWMDALDLWSSFSQRITTIYLPDRKRPMLPTVLSDALCSLQEKRMRFAFTLDVCVDKESYEIKDVSFKNCCIRVRENFRYDTERQENDETYKFIKAFILKINRKYRYVDNIETSHDIIAYSMILMNYLAAQEMLKYNTGIFRTAKLSGNFVAPDNVPSDVVKFLKMWNSFGGKYVKFHEVEGHDMLELDAYIHITSPIRRLVDLLNIIELQKVLGIVKISEKGEEFYNKWTSPEMFEYINVTMRSVRKVQNDCALLNICVNDERIRNKIHEGFIFDKIQRNDGLYQYMVYFPEMKMVNRFTSRHDKDNLSSQNFRLFIFLDEIRLKQKIRVEMVNE